MNLTFLGVGAAFDEDHTNISMILETPEINILLDCGYSVPHAYWKQDTTIDAVWISHAHADHYYGLGPLAIRMKDEGRKRPLHILTRPKIKGSVKEVIHNAYPGSIEKAPYDVNYHTFENTTTFKDLHIAIAPTIHTVPNKAIRIEHDNKAFCYSGDGEHTEESTSLYNGADFLVHETFTKDTPVENHSMMRGVARIAGEEEITKTAAVHINRNVRDETAKTYAQKHDLIVPEEGDTFSL